MPSLIRKAEVSGVGFLLAILLASAVPTVSQSSTPADMHTMRPVIRGRQAAISSMRAQATEAARIPPAPTQPAPALVAPPVSPPATPKLEETKATQPAPETSGEQEAQSEGSAPSGDSQDDQQP